MQLPLLSKLYLLVAALVLATGLTVGLVLMAKSQVLSPKAQTSGPATAPTSPAPSSPAESPLSVQEVTQAVVWVSTQVNQQTAEVEIKTLSDHLSEKGDYAVTFSFDKGPQNTQTGPIQLLVALEKDRCPEGNGQTRLQSVRYSIPSTWTLSGYCFVPFMEDEYFSINLTPENNYHQEITVSTAQVNPVACGSFQTDIWVLSLNGSETFSMKNSLGSQWSDNNCPLKRLPDYQFSHAGKTYKDACMINAWGNLKTGKDLATCTTGVPPTSTPTPNPTPTICPAPPAVQNLQISCPSCTGEENR